MAATARMILQVDPAEKARWTAEARKAGISTSEFVRRRAAGADPDPDLLLTPEEAEAIKLMTVEINSAAVRMAAKLDAMHASLAEFHDPDWYERIRVRVRAELEASGERLDLDKLRELGRLRDLAA